MPSPQQITGFASGRTGQQVGDGECFALADGALRAAGYRSAADFGAVSADADYVWGSAISVGQLQEGDVVQFRNYSVRTVTRTDRDDGSFSEREDTVSRPHHTAIVASVGSNGAVVVFEQNVSGQRVVLRNSLAFASSSTTSPADGGGTTVTTVTVTGRLWFYRPVPR